MKTKIKYYWVCSYKVAAKFLKKTGLADNMLLGKCRCELKAVEV